MAWVYRSTYAGPDRRSTRFAVHLFERRNAEGGDTAERGNAIRAFFSGGLGWVDHFNYFGPERRGKHFSFFFFFDRRRAEAGGKPPPLATALRRLRVRLASVESGEDRALLRERLVATALLADAQGFEEAGHSLRTLARNLDDAPGDDGDLGSNLRDELNRIEATII